MSQMHKTGLSYKSSKVVKPAAVWNPDEAIFERMILIIPYKAPDMVQ